MAAKELNFEFSELTFDTKGVVDLRGLMGQPDVSTHFQSLTFAVSIKTNESAERLQMLQDAVVERCPVYNLLRDASVSLHTEAQKNCAWLDTVLLVVIRLAIQNILTSKLSR